MFIELNLNNIKVQKVKVISIVFRVFSYFLVISSSKIEQESYLVGDFKWNMWYVI